MRGFVERARVDKKAAAIMFLDLAKAFDRLVRQVAFGVAQAATPAEVRATLQQAGVAADAAAHIAEFIQDKKSALHELEIPEHLVRLVDTLHTNAWFKLDAEGRLVVTRRGSRQGCRFGALIFNCCYAKSLKELEAELTPLGVRLVQTIVKDGPPWAHQITAEQRDALSQEEVHECTYVDDEALLLVAPSCAKLAEALPKIVSITDKVTRPHGMVVNWEPGNPRSCRCGMDRVQS